MAVLQVVLVGSVEVDASSDMCYHNHNTNEGDHLNRSIGNLNPKPFLNVFESISKILEHLRERVGIRTRVCVSAWVRERVSF